MKYVYLFMFGYGIQNFQDGIHAYNNKEPSFWLIIVGALLLVYGGTSILQAIDNAKN